ncbi:hypothetical protein BG58_40925 [Caballeronia jiangsuensis]|nr:hypothetical protein BG58_40925 [Caballeronia jiangsuensis]
MNVRAESRSEEHERSAALWSAIEQCEQALDRAPYRNAACRALLIASRALLERIKARKPRRSLEIIILLVGVTRLASNEADLEQARKQYDKASAAYAHSAGFMSVAYVIIATNLIPLNLPSTSRSGMTFTIAFLCGFSEKFAPSLLDRVGAAFSGLSRKP